MPASENEDPTVNDTMQMITCKRDLRTGKTSEAVLLPPTAFRHLSKFIEQIC